MWSLGSVSLLLGAGLVGWSRSTSARTPGQVYAGYVLGEHGVDTPVLVLLPAGVGQRLEAAFGSPAVLFGP